MFLFIWSHVFKRFVIEGKFRSTHIFIGRKETISLTHASAIER